MKTYARETAKRHLHHNIKVECVIFSDGCKIVFDMLLNILSFSNISCLLCLPCHILLSLHLSTPHPFPIPVCDCVCASVCMRTIVL